MADDWYGNFDIIAKDHDQMNSAGLPRTGKNIFKIKFYQVREKSGNFMDSQGNLERTWKVREKSGN